MENKVRRKRRNIFELSGAALRIILNEGWSAFAVVMVRWLKECTHWVRNYAVAAYFRKIGFQPSLKDVLFINGCGLSHPYRYRVEHQIEQLEFNGFTCDHVWYEDVKPDMIKYYHAFIVFRCPITDILKQFIALAQHVNKKVFYDIDDLIIDEKYVKNVKYLQTVSRYEYNLYMEGVQRMRETMLLCDYVITTTPVLAREIEACGKEVFVNRNVASEAMVLLSHKAAAVKKSRDKLYLGYLSGSITHNPDLEMIVPVLSRILDENPCVYLVLCGLIEVPQQLLRLKSRLIIKKFVDWKKLPGLIASLDINLAPLEQGLFNEAKSENRWTEASLAKVVTIASDLGAFVNVMEDGVNGLLCADESEWYIKLKRVIEDGQYRRAIAQRAYEKVIESHITAHTGKQLADFIKSKMATSIGMMIPGTRVSGGINVIRKHSQMLCKAGYDVTMLSESNESSNMLFKQGEIPVVAVPRTSVNAYFDKLVASLWSTRTFVDSYPKVDRRYYLVQGYETDFYFYGSIGRRFANSTYGDLPPNIKYITISRWCQGWLKEKFGKDANYAPNGIDLSLFKFQSRDFSNRIRVLIEGDNTSYYKNVDESFRIAAELDAEKFEIWYLSNVGKPKAWYRIDSFFSEIPYEKVPEIYQQCHILIKSTILESFSYPPLEMMATGGICIAAPNNGNIEYLKDRENCLLYQLGDVKQAAGLIREVISNKDMRDQLINGGLNTARERSWDNIETDIVQLYQ